MSIIRDLPAILKRAEDSYLSYIQDDLTGAGGRSVSEDTRRLYSGASLSGDTRRLYSGASRMKKVYSTVPPGVSAGSQLFMCDNLTLMSDGIRSGWLRESLDLIYCDPPFFTQASQGVRIPVNSVKCPDIKALRLNAYEDIYDRDIASYLEMLAVRLYFMRDALKLTGSIFIHLDWHAVHAVKLMMDEIFGEENFINEIIWTYKSGGAAHDHFARKHDTILFYSRSPLYKFFPQKEKSYNRGLKPYRFKGVEEFQDELGWYTMVNQKDVWDINMVGRSAAERVNYATQKPEALMKRIIEAVTERGDLCADFFCGSGTLGAAAAALDRRFLCADMGSLAVSTAAGRFTRGGIPFDLWAEDISPVKPGRGVLIKGVTAEVRAADRGILGELVKKDKGALISWNAAGTVDETGCFRAEDEGRDLFSADIFGNLMYNVN